MLKMIPRRIRQFRHRNNPRTPSVSCFCSLGEDLDCLEREQLAELRLSEAGLQELVHGDHPVLVTVHLQEGGLGHRVLGQDGGVLR